MIKVLRQGVHVDNNYEGFTNFEPIYGSSTLIKTGGKNILVDAGHIGAAKELNELLKKEGLNPEDIDYLFLTHHHLDHSSNMGAFNRAKIFIGNGYADPDKPSYMIFSDFSKFKLPEHFKLIETPGHTDESMSYSYEENGVRYICAGDAVREDVIREGAKTVKSDPDKYTESMARIFKIADVIIPGHGRIIEGKIKKELEKILGI